MAITVFISYSHDSQEHLDRVWDLSEQLRLDGIECRIDQHEESPPGGWPRWCKDQVEQSAFVLVLCTENYKLRYEGKAPSGTGLGAKWEGYIITQQIYEAEGKDTKFIPIVFSDGDVSHIPVELRGGTYYSVGTDKGPITTDKGYIRLLRRLTARPERRPRVVSKEVRPLPTVAPQAPSPTVAADLPPLPKLERKQPTENWIAELRRDWFRYGYPDRWELQEADNREHSGFIKANPKMIDLHLSYSEGFEVGPIIQRSGDWSPVMNDPTKPGSFTADPEGQRIGTNYILDSKRREHSEDLFLLFAANYVLFANLPLRKGDPTLDSKDDDQPWKFVLRTLEESHPSLKFESLVQALQTDDINVQAIARAATDFIPGTQAFLELKKDIFRTPGDNSPFPFFHDFQNQRHHIEERCDRLITDYFNNADLPEFVVNFATHREQPAFRAMVEFSVRKYSSMFILSRTAWSHEERARHTGKGSKVVFMQGCGDLTMNLWNVAFVSGDSCYNNYGWDLLHSPDEPLNDREYTCLIKWNCAQDDNELREIAARERVVYPYQIASLRFMAPWVGKRESSDRHVFLGEKKVPIGHLIEFAVYGKQIYCGRREAQPDLSRRLWSRLRAVIPQFSDVRHIYRLPNLNPPVNFQGNETSGLGIGDYAQKPRYLFNERTLNDMWLGERGLIQGDRNLRVAALNQAIYFDKRELGAPEEWIKFILRKDKDRFGDQCYKEGEPVSELERGQWRWIKEGRENWLEIFFHLNHYPCSMIGVTAKDEELDVATEQGQVVETKDVFFCAHGHNYGRGGCTILEAAQYLAAKGAWNILVFDEGEDVFQLLDENDGKGLKPMVPLRREQIRCVFWGTTKTNTVATE